MTTLEFNNQMLHHHERLNYFALSLTSDKDNADDLLQETYLKALLNKDRYQDNTNFKAWIYTIMKNIFINSYRRAYKSSAKMNSTDDPYKLNGSIEMSKYTIAPDTEFNIKEINKIIDALTEEFRIPFRMHYEGYKYKEISEELGLNIGTVKSRIFHARKRLMDTMEEYKN